MNERKKIEKLINKMISDKQIGEQERDYALLLLAATEVGTGIKALSDFSGQDQDLILPIHRNLRKSYIFTKEGTINCDWIDPKLGDLAFTLDLGVAKGNMKRTKERVDGDFRYSLTAEGKRYVEEELLRGA